MEFEIRLSGSVEVRAAGRRSDLGSTKTRVTLAALAWDADRSVSVDTLIHRIWDDHPPVKAREALHAHVSRIRRALRIAGGDAPAIVSRTNAYVMRVDPDCVDLRCYTNRVTQSRSLRESDEEAALHLLDRADAVWYGEPLAGIAGSWPEHLRAAVGETSLAAAMTRADILIDTGRFADAVPVLLPLVEEHPVDEAMAERLAVALYGSSRTAEATRLLQRTRQRVVRDIGLDAGRRLHRVHQGILAGTPARDLPRYVDGGEAVSSVRPTSRAPDNLPRDVPWVGRRDELGRLGAVLREGDSARGVVVTVEAIHGMGGVGKTSLAVHVGHQLRDRFPDGRLFVHLGGHAPDRTVPTPARVLTELLRLLGMNVKELPRETDELVALWRSSARDRRMLVILDDAVDSDQVRPLLPGASPTVVIVTSRRRLPGLPGVRALALDVLPPEDATALFAQRLGRPVGSSEADLADIADIVRICDYLPLAVEIAASRLLARPSWTPADLLRQLGGGGGHLAELRDGERTMTHVFELSYRALNAEQQLVFRRVGLHGGVEFGPAAVAALTGLSTDAAERVLEELMTHFLVFEPSPHRFTMHDLLRGYARSLIEAGDVDTEEDARRAFQDLVDHYVGAADLADRSAYPFRSRMTSVVPGATARSRLDVTDAQTAEQWLITESANLLDTLDWVAEHGSERRLALVVHALAGFLDMEGHLAKAEPLLRRAVGHWRDEDDSASLAQALLDLSSMHTHGSRFEEAIAEARDALEIARSLGDTELEVQCIQRLSLPLWQTGQYALTQSLQKRSLDLLTKTGSKLQIARSRNHLGITHLHLAEDQKALECFTAALTGFTELGEARGMYSAMNNLAELHQRMGNPQAAERVYRDALGVAEGVGSKRDQATLHMNLAGVLEVLGKTDEALALFDGVLVVMRSVGDRRGETIALNGIGRACRAAGRFEEALAWHTAALELARRIHAAGEEVDVLYDLARCEQGLGRMAQAAASLAASLSISKRIGAPAEEARAMRALTELSGISGGPVVPEQ
ncbi:tetratricopeptide repeat protein [Streptomyces prunicolor]|uniref:AfsR/SARP family transcriptional regulator n=1 Tax=Streptomyces prunicolor TaxID=67348 RepID=UPI00224F294E|nr:tetratricopeptide repeat protein [Streptomyces prunicolor]MCX5235979.1 tetratricopeptide repeat protein [Streptomyces prunicolor]